MIGQRYHDCDKRGQLWQEMIKTRLTLVVIRQDIWNVIFSLKDFLEVTMSQLIKTYSAEEYILQLLKNHNIIGLGEGEHNLVDSHQFFQKIPNFPNSSLT